MAYRVGSKGQVVIDKEIRDALGIERGYLATQRIVEDHVEIRFFPPEHMQSLRGVLAEAAKHTVRPEEWHQAREEAWNASATEKLDRGKRGG